MDKDFIISWLEHAPYRIRNAAQRARRNVDVESLRDIAIGGAIVVSAAWLTYCLVDLNARQPESEQTPIVRVEAAPETIRPQAVDAWALAPFPLIGEPEKPVEQPSVQTAQVDAQEDERTVSRYCQRHPRRRSCRG